MAELQILSVKANQRHDFHFKLAQRLWGRKISDLAFGDFVQILKYEASKFGTLIIEVGRFFASSQLCSSCGYQNSQVKDLSVRQWICPKCGAMYDRDKRTGKCVFVGTGSGVAKANDYRALGIFKFKTFECPKNNFMRRLSRQFKGLPAK